jgi:hypothetical protein
VIGGLPKPPSVRARKEARKRPPVPVAVRFLMALWDDRDVRAILACGLLAFRQSPEHGKRLTEILALANWALELAAQSRSPRDDDTPSSSTLIRNAIAGQSRGKLRPAHARR